MESESARHLLEDKAEFHEVTGPFLANISTFAGDVAGLARKLLQQIAELPFRLVVAFWDWICLPMCRLAWTLLFIVWNGICWLTDTILQLARQLGHFLSDLAFAPISRIASAMGSARSNKTAEIWTFLRDRLISPAGLFAWHSSAELAGHFENVLTWIGTSLARTASLLASPFEWAGGNLLELGQSCWAGVSGFWQAVRGKGSQLFGWARAVASSTFSATWQFLHSLGHSLLHLPRSALALPASGVRLVGRAGEKLVDGLVWAWNSAGDGLLWGSGKVESFFGFVWASARDGCARMWPKIVHIFWWPVQKAGTVLAWTIGKAVSLVVGPVKSIWQTASQFQFPAMPGLEEEKQQQGTANQKQLLPAHIAELAELPDDHPVVLRFRQIVLRAFVEESRSMEQRIREWAEGRFKRQSSGPGLAEEAEDFGHFKEDLERKVEKWQEQERHKFREFDEQVDQRIRQFVAHLGGQIGTENAKMNEKMEQIRQKQAELEKKEKKSPAEEEEEELVVKRERQLGEEGGRESTVLLRHVKHHRVEGHFDEQALLERVRSLVRQELRRYDADRTGMADFALESSGGSVLSTRCTVQYNERSRTQKLFGIPLWFSSYSPRTVIQRKGYGASAGECWAYYGGHGFLTIGLSKRINVTAVSYEHLPLELSPEGHIRTAPKNFLVWSYQGLEDTDSRLLLGNFTFDARGEPLQIFPVQHWDPRLTQILELETLSNWGAPVTCLYRFRVHGDMGEVIPEEEAAADETGLGTLEAASHLPSAGHRRADEKDIF